jgi:hypothetical protein
MVELSREEVMMVLPESDQGYLVDTHGVVAERWLCFFVHNPHSLGPHSDNAAQGHRYTMSPEDKQSIGTARLELDDSMVCDG